MKRLILFLLLIAPISTFAQTEANDFAPFFLEGANFFICVIAGLLLAIAFQLLLTMLSVAGGITAIGDITKQEGSSHSHDSHSHEHDDEGMNTAQKISTGLGAWTMVTTSIALFFASLLAVKLGLIAANFIGATLGLVIWAAFFIVMSYLEMSAVSSLIGGLVSTVKNSLSSVFSGFSKSEESMAKEVAKTSAKAQSKEMRKQLEKLFSTHDIDKKVEDYIQQLEPQKIDINNLKKQIKDLLTHLQVTEKSGFDYPNSVKKMILEEADKSTLSKENKQAVKEHVSSLKDIATNKDTSNVEKAKEGIAELTPADREHIDKYQEKIKNALRNTNKEELQPEKLEQDLKRILNEPGEATNIAKAKASALDRDTLVKLLASQNMSESEANNYVQKVENVLQKVSAAFGSAGSKTSSEKDNIKSKISSMFSGAGSSFHIDQVYSDFTSMFQNSAAGPDLKYKLEHYNKEEMTVLITNKTSLSRDEAEPIAEKIVSARDSVLEKAHEVEAKVNQKMAEVKQKTLEAAEESRKAAVTAAWWLVGTAILSAAASAVGGILALEGLF